MLPWLFASLVCGFFIISFCTKSRAREKNMYLSSRLLSWCHFMAYVTWISWDTEKISCYSGKDVSLLYLFFLVHEIWHLERLRSSSSNWYTQNICKFVVKSSPFFAYLQLNLSREKVFNPLLPFNKRKPQKRKIK